jgi:predicted transglutaminase-like cysteine proteinase
VGSIVVRRLLTWPPVQRCLASMVALLGTITMCVASPDLDRVVELALARYGVDAARTVDTWRDLVERNRDLPEREKLELVNDFFNHSVDFEQDPVVWGRTDYWATPLETLGRGRGDCEDFSIGKYVTLGLMGVPIERLRITYVRAETGLSGSGIVQAHMVLAYYPEPGAEPVILDNLVGELRPASRRPDLKPVFGFNSQGLWIAGRPASSDPTARLSRWRDLLRRMNEEGLN